MANEVAATEPVITTEPTDNKPLDSEIAKIVNSAVTSQIKRLTPKIIEQYEAAKKSALPVEDATKETPSSSPELDEIRKTVKTLSKALEASTAREKAATTKARTATLNTELTSALKGKVTEDWLDVAVEKLAAKAVFSADDEPSLKFGEDELSVSDGVAEWMKDPSAKRFLAAPKSSQGNRPQPTINKFLPVPSAQNTRGIDPLSPEYENVMAQALVAQGGLLGKR